MNYMKYSISIFAVISIQSSYGVKVNMQGSLSFGKDVLDSLSHYMRRNYMSGRRSMPISSKEEDMLYLIVKSTYLCRDIIFCEDRLELFLNEYITLLTKSVEAIFESIMNQAPKPDQENKTEEHLFEEELKRLLRDIRKLLRITNTKVSEKNEPYLWIDVIKKISAMFQESAIVFATDRLDDSPADTTEIKKKLMQKFIIAIVILEGKYESKLCTDHDICTKAYECTKALNTLLAAIQELEIDKVKIFIRYVAESLLDTTFYSHVSETTANALQVIFNDMSYSDNVPTKDVLHSIQKTVEERLSAMKLKKHFVGGNDVELLHAILSDMDHFYAKRKDPFHFFLTRFFDWTRMEKKLGMSVRDVMKEIADRLYDVPDPLQVKLIHELRAFLELTVDPEK